MTHNLDNIYLQYEDSKSLLVISRSGQLRRLFCPFPVICIREYEDLEIGQTLIVEAVLMETFDNNDLEFQIIIFIINDNKIYYWYFKIP